MKWPLISLKQICNTQYGYTASADDFNVGPKYLRITDIASGPIDWESVPYCKISESDYPKYRLNAGDIVIARTGNTTGYAKLIREDNNAIFASYLVRIKIKSDLSYSGYIGRLVESDIYKNFVKSIKGGAAQGNANATTLTLFKFRLPPIEIQKTIASILSTYDDLFDNNRKRIQLLEESARLLFREWFVYFRFPFDSAQGRPGHEKVHPIRKSNSNGVKIVGDVPEGWKKRRLVEVADIAMGQSPKSVYYNDNGFGLPFHQGVTGFGDRFPTNQIYCTQKNRMAQAGDILFSVRAPVGRINISTEKIIIGRGLSAIRSKENHQSYLFYELKNHFFKEDMIGGGAIFAAITKKDLENVVIIYPDERTIEQFEKITNPIDRQINILSIQNQKLAQARDLLLPRLMSGAIEV